MLAREADGRWTKGASPNPGSRAQGLGGLNPREPRGQASPRGGKGAKDRTTMLPESLKLLSDE